MGNTAAVPFMITRLQELRLKGLGYSQPQIDALTPSQAHAILAEFDAPDPSLDAITLDNVPALDPEPAQRTRAYQPNAQKCHTGVTVRSQPNRHNALLSAALAYAAQGIYVMPIHEPLFDADGKLTGCTCEAWKRSKKYFEWLRAKGLEKKFNPTFKCRTPGKHPRITDWETNASNDPDQIRAWWHKWPTANLGVAVGKSGLVTFDRDTYKEVYGDDSDLFTQADKETPTQISGGGGEHLVYQMPQGKAYTNANNTLPPGVDIRGVGGMQVVAPSLHPSGRLYEWEEGYSLFERDPLPLPQALQAILDAAQHNSTPAKAVTFSTVTSEKPELLRWRLGTATRELINAPGQPGKRSENDMSVCVSLVYAGATDDEILAVFQHYPIGTDGKYADGGDRYLALTIGNARAYVEEHPPVDVGATVAQMRLWVRTHSFEPFMPDEFLTLWTNPNTGAQKLIYVTDSTDTKIADAIFDVMEVAGMLAVNVGKKRLAKLAGVGSKNTVAKALARLAFLFDVTPNEQGTRIALCDQSRLHQIDPLLAVVYRANKGGQSGANDVSTPDSNAYSPHKADEPFLLGISRTMRDRFKLIAQTLGITVQQAKLQDDLTFPGLGEASIRIIDALLRAGDMTAQELVEETGKKMSSIRTAVRKLVQHGILHAERACVLESYTYSLCDDVWGKLAEVAPTLRNYIVASKRENKRLESAQQWVKKGIAEAKEAQDTEQEQRLEHRFAELAKQRVSHLARLHADKGLAKDDIIRLAYEVADYKQSPKTEQAVRTAHTEATDEHRDTVRMIKEIADERYMVGMTLDETIADIMQFGIFDCRMVENVLRYAWKADNFETLPDVRKRLPKVKPTPKTYMGWVTA